MGSILLCASFTRLFVYLFVCVCMLCMCACAYVCVAGGPVCHNFRKSVVTKSVVTTLDSRIRIHLGSFFPSQGTLNRSSENCVVGKSTQVGASCTVQHNQHREDELSSGARHLDNDVLRTEQQKWISVVQNCVHTEVHLQIDRNVPWSAKRSPIMGARCRFAAHPPRAAPLPSTDIKQCQLIRGSCGLSAAARKQWRVSPGSRLEFRQLW